MFSSLKIPAVSRKSLYEAIFTISGRFVSIFLVIGATKFLTTFLSEADYGQLALYNVTATLPSTFYFGPLGQGILRLFPVANEKSELNAFHHQYHRLYMQGAQIVLILGLIGSALCWFYGSTSWSLALILMVVISTVGSFNTFRYGLQNSIRKRMLSMGLETGDRVLQQTLAIFLLWCISGNPLIVLVGYALSSFIFLLINRYYYHKSFPETADRPSDSGDKTYRAMILQYSWPFILFGIFAWFQNASDRWALEILHSTELVGQYAVLNQIGFQSLGLLFGSISYFLFPILFNKQRSIQSKKQFDDANHINNWYLWFNVGLTAFLFLIFWLFGEEVIRLLSAEKYVKLAGYLPLMVIAGGLFNFGQNYTNRFMLAMQTRLLLYPKIIAAVLGVILNFILGYRMGLQGLIIGTVLTQFIYVSVLVITWTRLKHSTRLSN